MTKLFLILISLLFVQSCSNFTPLYKEKDLFSKNLKAFVVITDKKKISLSIKKNLLKKLPSAGNNINYILKIETLIDNTSTATDTQRKTSGYEIITTAKVFLYKREKKYDRKIFAFEEKSVGLFNFSPNQVLSTLAARNRVLDNSSEELSDSILYRLILYFSNK